MIDSTDTKVRFPNRLAEERAAAGLALDTIAARTGIERTWYEHIEAGRVLASLEEFDRIRAVLGDVPEERLYPPGLANTIGGKRRGERPDYAEFFRGFNDASHLLISREEIDWLEKDTAPDRKVDVFVRLSCGTQAVPHLLQDTVAVMKALGVSFAAGAGRTFCCGTYYRGYGDTDAGSRMFESTVARTSAWGARTTVHFCTQCQNTVRDVAARRELVEPDSPPKQDLQLLTFLEQRLLELGDRVPWRTRASARVLVIAGNGMEGGPDISPVHGEARRKVADVLRLVPGVEVLGFVDPVEALGISFTAPPRDRDEVIERRNRIADLVRSRGADTISHFHHSGQRGWSRYASDRVAVRHAVSIVAEALGCASPDRFQAASMLGDPDAALEQLRPMWESWGMSEERARLVARELFDPLFGAGPACGSCGGGGQCREHVISVDDLHSGAPRSYRV